MGGICANPKINQKLEKRPQSGDQSKGRTNPRIVNSEFVASF